MSIFLRSLAAVCIISAPIAATAQITIGSQSNSGTVLRAGTQVPLKTVSELTTNGKKLRVGDRFNLEVSEPVRLHDRIVIPAGSVAIGEITTVRNKGMWGKSGNIDARVLYVRANGQQIRLSGGLHDKGTTGTGAVVGAVVLLPLAGFFMTGTSATLPPGTAVMGYLDEDLPVVFADGTAPPPTAMVIPAATAASAVAAVSGDTQNVSGAPK
ncbi:hypothetical protein [Sphingomonas sp. SRS2]|uniref:hypothetical protein n=1 Tax=Sphingomonas sp. SRS2 TaxID=133190 RepID=UPI0006184959|nr:hypothetical protein [Sphingomonas sp. SRS2]KKC27951.1 hypothetical protein WP12_00515 [Sphingomonas sp. SRS2]